MKLEKSLLTTVLKLLGCVALTFCAVSAVQADDKPNVAGTWSWTRPGRNGGPDVTNTLTLKIDGDTVTGSLSAPGRNRVNKSEITEGKITGNEVTFKITNERNGTTTTMTYTGKITGDTIEGKIKRQTGDNEPRTSTWKAARATAGS